MIENHIEGTLQELLTSTYPHHLHLETSEVIKSIPMNLKKALREIEGALSIL